MATEIPQRGSVLSLISSKNVRYEGILDRIEMGTESSSLSLMNVRSFGTEDRADRARYVAPSHEVFDSILFSGQDIISLDVKQYHRGPPYVPPSQSAGYGQQAGNFAAPPPQPVPQQQPQQPQQSVWGPPGTSPANQDNAWGSQAGSYGQPGAYSQVQSSQPYNQASAPPAPAGPPVAPAPTVMITPSAPPRPQPARPQPPQARAPQTGENQSTPFKSVQQPALQANGVQPVAPAPKGVATADSSAGPPPGFLGPPPGMQPTAAQAAPTAPGNSTPRQHGGRGEQGRGRGRGRGRGPGRGHGGREGGPRAPPVPVPREDFNFEEGLSKFDKSKALEETPEEEVSRADSQPGGAYKKDDFFDELSSDLKDRLSTEERPARVPFSEQRKVDIETFGGSGVARRPMRGRGRRGRGRGRGRGQYSQPLQVSS